MAGCTPDAPRSASLTADAPTALADQPIHIRATGLAPGAEVEITGEAIDYQGVRWRSSGTFTADDDGTIDLRRDAPSAGTYTGADGMGLLWSMRSDKPGSSFFPNLMQDDYAVTLSVNRTQLVLRRQLRAEGQTREAYALPDDPFTGVLHNPPATPKIPVLFLSGSDGNPDHASGAMLAARGHPTLALDYFGGDGLPETLRDVPLEYFADAVRAAGLERAVVIGYSRGSEAALLLAERYPDLFPAAVVYAPNDHVVGSFPEGGDAWTYGGKPVPHGPIPDGRLSDRVLAVAGGDDAVWPAGEQAARLAERIPGTELLAYPQAGHGVGTWPYLPSGTRMTHPVTGDTYDNGGTSEADAAARADAWPRVLAFLDSVR